MRIARKWALLLALMLACTAAMQAQEKPKPVLTPVKVQVVFSEYDGEKRISNVPYVLAINVPDNRPSDFGKVRIGVQVPLTVQGKEGAQTQYRNVGTDIDVRAEWLGGGSFRLNLSTRRSFLYSPAKTEETAELRMPASGTPIFREYVCDFDTVLKDGQTFQGSIATDPVSGRVLKVDVTLTVVK
jgi:hypothetical protein